MSSFIPFGSQNDRRPARTQLLEAALRASDSLNSFFSTGAVSAAELESAIKNLENSATNYTKYNSNGFSKPAAAISHIVKTKVRALPSPSSSATINNVAEKFMNSVRQNPGSQLSQLRKVNSELSEPQFKYYLKRFLENGQIRRTGRRRFMPIGQQRLLV
jgi:hypothetical protein